MKLTKSKVVFDPIEHTYTLDGKSLSGITGIISRYLFPNKYDAVAEQVLRKAKERGAFIHEQIQCSLNGFEPAEQSEELVAFKSLGLKVLESEYLVSDNTDIATSIDLVIVEGKNSVSLADIKTTAVLDREYLSWQLSICAYLFESNNPKIKIEKLYGIHLRGSEAKVVEITRLPDDAVVELLTAFTDGKETFDNPLKQVLTKDEELLAKALEFENVIVNLKQQVDAYNKLQDEIKAQLMAEMDKRGITKWETEHLTITRKADSVRKSVDSKKLQAQHPDIYEECLKESNVKGSILISVL